MFDHHSPDHAADPVGAFRAIREGAGVVRSDRYGGFALLTRYDDVVAVARDHERFSNLFELPDSEGFGGGTTLPHNPTAPRMSFSEMDPPDWDPIRRFLNPRFSVGAAQRFAPRIRAITNDFIDRFIERGACDFVFDLCSPVPAVVTLEYLGLPTHEWERWSVPIHTSVYTPRDPQHPAFAKLIDSFAWIHEQIRETIAERKRSPKPDDLISDLLRDDGSGPFMDDELAFQTVYVLLAAGVDTTTSLLSAALRHLAQHDDDRQRLIAEPGLLPAACEEFLRLYSPAQATARTTTTDVEVRGEHLERGDRVLLGWASANRDASHFEEPDRFVIDRPNNRHVAFAHGIHRCLGAPLARQEFVEIMGEVLRRLPDFQIDLANSPRYPDVGLMFGFQNLPSTFTPGPFEGRRPDQGHVNDGSVSRENCLTTAASSSAA
jgi:cytochrome P450